MKALALGGADCVWDDVAASEQVLCEDWWDIVVACNRAGTAWPDRLDHWVTLHPDKLAYIWEPERERQDYETWMDPNCGREDSTADHQLDNWGGSSGLFCVTVALEVGASRIVVCGMPMSDQPHFHGRAVWGEHDKFRDAWNRHLDDYGDRTRSMSGWTRELLGAPTREWLKDGD